MARTPDLPVVLLPIQPRYARPIMEGRKTVEFRKTVFSSEPAYVVVYASTPVQRVLGYFQVRGIEVAPVSSLWEEYAHVGCIGRDDFAAYYGDRERGLVLRVGEVITLPEPVALSDLGLSPRPPQSYAYVDVSVLDLIDRRIEHRPLAPAVEPVSRTGRRLPLGVAFA